MTRVARKREVAVDERYDVLKRMLEERRAEIQDKLRSIRETRPAEADQVKDTEEQSVDDVLREVDFALMEMKSETLARIDEAVRRLEEGSYGVCAECGTEIASARLEALPFATRCRDCQERQETLAASEREVRAFEPGFAKEISAEAR
jgi:RNA polymerase-binding transcription factor